MTKPHQITLKIIPPSQRAPKGVEVYTHAGTGLAADHPADALARLCRRLASLGATGPAEVRGEDGRLRVTVRAIESLAVLSLTENDRDGIRWRRHAPLPMAAARTAA